MESIVNNTLYETVREQNQYNWELNNTSKKDHECGKGACEAQRRGREMTAGILPS